MATAPTITKRCNNCKQEVALIDFYLRSKYRGKIDIPTKPQHVISECKKCMLKRSRNETRLSPHKTRTMSEMMFIEYLASRGIPSLPGKALKDVWVDVVALGHVWIEVKYSKLYYSNGADRFRFMFTPRQVEHGPQGHIIALMCDWDDHQTYHFFPWNFVAFHHGDGARKSSVDFVPGKMEAIKHHNRNVMTQPMMDSARDNTALITRYLNRIHEALCEGERPEYGKPFAR